MSICIHGLYYINRREIYRVIQKNSKYSNPVTGPVVAQREVEVKLYSSRTSALEEGEWSASCPGRTLLPGKTRYPLYRRLGGHQGRSGRAENLALTGIRSPDRPARSQSLYRLSYPAHQKNSIFRNFTVNKHKGVQKPILYFCKQKIKKFPPQNSCSMRAPQVALSFRKIPES